MSCISLSPAISKAPVITSSPLKTECAGKTALLDELRKRHRKYLKRLKEQPSEEINETRNCDTITHSKQSHGSPFKMDSKDLALRIVTRTRMKMSRNPFHNKRPLLTSSPIRQQQKKMQTTSFETPSGKKKPPPLSISSIEKLTPPLSLEYSQRYKGVQKKWQDEIHLHRKQQSPCQNKLPLTVEGQKDIVQRLKSDVSHRSQISVDVTNLSPMTTTCKRRLTFTNSRPMNQPAMVVTVSQKKLQNNVLVCHVDTKVRQNVALSKNNNETLLRRKNKQNIPDSTSKNDVAEKAAQAAKLRQERINLKAIQRTQIYALNAVMKEFEEANFAKELSSRESLNPPSITK